MELTYLINEANRLGNCQPGMAQLKSCETVKDLIECYYDRIDYCLANNFPGNDYLMQYREELRAAGVFIDERVSIGARPRMVLLGQSDCTLTAADWTVTRAYVKHKSKLRIIAKDYSIIMVDALDDTEVIVEQSKYGKVIVNLYANATTTDAYRVIKKNRFTYEL